MKNFFKDLWELQKQSNQFMKEHWLGYTVFTLTCSAGVLIPVFVKAKKDAKEAEEAVKAFRDSLLSACENSTTISLDELTDED